MKRLLSVIFMFGMIIAAFPSLGNAAIYYVNAAATGANNGSSWTDAYTDLQSAMNKPPVSGDEIWVAKGVYKPAAAGSPGVSFVIKPGVRYYGHFAGTEGAVSERNLTDPATQSILSGDIDNNDTTDAYGVVTDYNNVTGTNTVHVVLANSASIGLSTVLDGFTITAGSAGAAWGSGLYLLSGSAPTVNNMIFTGNKDGYAMYAGGNYVLSNSKFIRNGGNGGGIGMTNISPTLINVEFSYNVGQAITLIDGSPTLTNVDFNSNSRTTGDGGAMIITANGTGTVSPTFTNCNFTGNTATGSGGAIINRTYNGANIIPTFINCKFIGNTAGGGGAIFNQAGGVSSGIVSPTFTNVIFSGNTAGNGGAFYNMIYTGTNGSAILTNVIFTGNKATTNGGAIYSEIYNSGTGTIRPVLTNVTFSGNLATNGGAIYNKGTGGINTPTLKNVIMFGNWISTAGAEIYNKDANPSITHSLIEGGITGSGVYNTGTSSITDGGGNIDANPLFVNPIPGTSAPTTAGDYHLQCGSPAFDAGLNAAVPGGVITDLDGNPRIRGNAVDMGAYEKPIPAVSTGAASLFTATSASVSANVTDNGGSPVSDRGVCYGTSPKPATSCISNGSGLGSFTTALTGLSPNTPYYARAYATNSTCRVYGSDVTFTTLAPPTITGISPASGIASGGTNVTITGTNFADGATTVSIGGHPAQNVTVVAGSEGKTITCKTPLGIAGAADVVVTVGTQSVTLLGAFTYTLPTITGISPNFGSISGGTTVTINGENFIGATAVKFGGNPLGGSPLGILGTIVSVAADGKSITCTTPPFDPNPANMVADSAGRVMVKVMVGVIEGYSLPPSGGFGYYYTANFAAAPLTYGTVNPSSPQQIFGAQTSPVTATPTTGYTFINWKDQNGTVVSTSPTLSAQTITKDMTYTAFFGIVPIISSISPATITPTAATPLTISGSGFSAGAQIWLSTGSAIPTLTAGLTQLSASPVSSALINASVPANFLPGTYYVFVYDPVSTIWSAAANSTANVLTVNPSGLTYTWTGHETPAAPTDWLKAGNWTPFWNTTARVPTDNAIIPGNTATMPVLASSATLNSLKIQSGGSLTINSGATLGTLNANAVSVDGTLINNGSIIIPASAKLVISPSGILKLTGGSIQIDPSNIPPNSGLVNQGKIEWSKGGIYTMSVTPPASCSFINEGQIVVNNQTGSSYFSNCNVTNGVNGLLEVIINNTLTIYEKDFTNLGTVRGGGTIYFDPYPSATLQTFINKGLVNPKIPNALHGPLNIRGNFSQESVGTLQLDVSGTDYDYLNVDGSVNLDGTIQLPTPLPPGSFDVVQATGTITAASTLRLPPAPSGYTITGEVVSGTPNVYRINIRRSGYTWSGAIGSNWADIGNWVEGVVPVLLTDSVIIPANCLNYPNINAHVSIGKITIETGASLTVQSGFNFNIHGDSTNNGTVNLLGGNVILNNNAVFTNNGNLIFITPEGAASKIGDAPASQGKLINNGMIVNQSFSGILDVANFEQIPSDSAKGISILSGDLRLASGNTQNTYTIGASAFSGDGTLIFGSDNPDTYPMIIFRDNVNINLPLRWVGGVVKKASDIPVQVWMDISKNAEIGSTVFKKLYGMDISIQSSSIVTLKDGEFYLGNRANFKNDGGILSIEGKMSFYNFDTDAALTGTLVNNGTVRGTGILSFAPNPSDPKPEVVFSNNGIISPGLSPGLLTLDMGNSVYDHSNGTLNIEINSSIAGSGYDRLNVIGNVKLGGTLNVTADSAYVPHDGDIFDILALMNTGTITGQFASVNRPSIPGFHWEPVSYASPVRLTLRQNTSAILTVSVDPVDSGTVSGNDITCPAVCSKTVDSTVASSITLSASANSGYVFDHWELNNAAAGTEPASLIVNFPANSMMTQAVKAVFRQIQKNRITLSVSPSGGGWVSGGGFSCGGGCASGTTCSDVCQKDFDPAVTPSITLNASANTGYDFGYWKVNDVVQTPSQTSLTVLTNSPGTVIAVFKPKTTLTRNLSVSVSPSGAGKVSVYQSGAASSECPGNCAATVSSGTKVSLYAMSNAGYHFIGWSGAVSSSSASAELTMDSNKSVTAYFEADTPSYETPTDYCPNDPNKTEPGKCGCNVADTDSDGDGVPDCLDKCPNDPKKTEPGKCGCGVADTDSDGDGVPDCLDRCPNDPKKTEPGICGCGVPETENCIEDKCPDDPNKTGPGKCGCGIADTDSDGDGVPDCLDKCPNDPKKTEPGKCGCGVPETENCGKCPSGSLKTDPGICGCDTADTDSDGDGRADCFDRCPNDPKKTEPGICGCGVPDTDSSGDGITDCLRGDPPKPPVLLKPGFQEIIAHGPVKLTASPFSAPGNQTHIATHWLIQRADMLYRSAKKALFDEHTVTSGNMTEFDFVDISPGLKYICKAGYRSSGNIRISWSDESSFIVGIPEQSPVSEIPAGETAEQYQMFSIPYWLQNEDAAAALGAIIGSYDPKMFRIGTYNAETGGYVEYGDGMKIIPGKAYWILARNGLKLTVTGVPVSLNHTMEVILDNGWNMIAAPNNADYDWSRVEILVYDDDLRVIYGPEAVSAGGGEKYLDTLWQWQNGDYVAANTLEKNKGYWLKAKQTGVVLRFPETARGKSATRSEKRSTSAEKPPMPMGNTGFSVNSDTGEAAGGCFIDTVLQK